MNGKTRDKDKVKPEIKTMVKPGIKQTGASGRRQGKNKELDPAWSQERYF